MSSTCSHFSHRVNGKSRWDLCEKDKLIQIICRCSVVICRSQFLGSNTRRSTEICGQKWSLDPIYNSSVNFASLSVDVVSGVELGKDPVLWVKFLIAKHGFIKPISLILTFLQRFCDGLIFLSMYKQKHKNTLIAHKKTSINQLLILVICIYIPDKTNEKCWRHEYVRFGMSIRSSR